MISNLKFGIRRMTTSTKEAITKIAIATNLFIIGLVTSTCIENVSCSGLFNTDAATSAGEQFVSLYLVWYWPAIIVTAILFAFSKDEKKKGIEKGVAIALSVVYIICLAGSGLITDTLAIISGWFTGN